MGQQLLDLRKQVVGRYPVWLILHVVHSFTLFFEEGRRRKEEGDYCPPTRSKNVMISSHVLKVSLPKAMRVPRKSSDRLFEVLSMR